jgi:hypothetical protein
VRFHLPFDRPGSREDLRIVHRELVSDGVRVGPAKPLGRVKGVGVHSIFFWILVVPVIERPSLVVSGLDHQRVAFPMSDRFSVERRLDIGFMGPAVERNDPGHIHELGRHHEILRCLDDLDRIRTEERRRKARGHAKRSRLVVAWIAGSGLVEQRFAARLEWRHLGFVEDGGHASSSWCLRVVPHAGQIRLAVGRSGNLRGCALPLGAGRHGRRRNPDRRNESGRRERRHDVMLHGQLLMAFHFPLSTFEFI